MKYIKVYLMAALAIILFSGFGWAGNIKTEKEIYCKYRQYEVNRLDKLNSIIYNTDDRDLYYKECVDSARAKLNFRRELYSEYHINGQQLNRIYRKGKKYKWGCSWF